MLPSPRALPAFQTERPLCSGDCEPGQERIGRQSPPAATRGRAAQKRPGLHLIPTLDSLNPKQGVTLASECQSAGRGGGGDTAAGAILRQGRPTLQVGGAAVEMQPVGGPFSARRAGE
jgi:hypothetical protein